MWYYTLEGQTYGPISEGDLDSRVGSGSIPSSTLVWRDGMAAWQPYVEVRMAAPSGLRVAPSTVREESLQAFDPAPGLASHVRIEDPPRGNVRFESTGSWIMVAVMVMAMFVFMGVLSSKPRLSPSLKEAMEQMDDVDDADDVEVASVDRKPERKAPQRLAANVTMRLDILNIDNRSTFDWPQSTVSFDRDQQTFSYVLDGLKKGSNAAITLTSFEDSNGNRFKAVAGKGLPSEFTLDVKGYGVAKTHLVKR